MKEIPSRYDPKQTEKKQYKFWVDRGCFSPEARNDNGAYTIVIPPPNITGSLTLGHVLNCTIQDILIRWRRMQGRRTLWLPGTDHAGIATQNVVEKELKKEGGSRHELGRDKFLDRVWKWRDQYGSRITEQLECLGCSCDWDRTRFTMDQGLSEAVTEVFVRLYKKGLIYRGNYIINWCPRCSTALSDEEAIHKDIEGGLYWIRYPIEGTDNEYVTVATTRPETMLGDTAVAVNPNDERYKHLHGKTVVLPIIGRSISVIQDEFVDPEFGSGIVKVTPAHDPNDFAMGHRHSLEFVNVIDEAGKMNENAGKYVGMDRFECRKHLIEELTEKGLFERRDAHHHSVAHCQRCDTMIEPYLSEQWFVKMKPLAEPAIDALRDGRITFHPARWTKVYFDWMENVRDWCISRQLWWGHRIPVWYCQECSEVNVSKEPVEKCGKCDSTDLKQDEDVLDTWFSSWLWPFSTLGWPQDADDVKTFYPTQDLVTAPDIIFFWVARMIVAGLEFLGDIPFSNVYFHGVVRDEEGRKMSKSLGNSPDPIDVMEKYGADALRFSMILITASGQDAFYSEQKVEIGRNFANKVWNASRLVLMNLEGYNAKNVGSINDTATKRTFEDRWILSRLQTATQSVNDSLEKFMFNEAAQTVYEFIWHQFCDWYLELIKVRLYGDDEEEKQVAQQTVAYVLDQSLRLLHPFMPFLTEEIWQHLNDAVPDSGADESVMISKWPERDETFVDLDLEHTMDTLQKIVRGVRDIRNKNNIAEKKPVPLEIQVPDKQEMSTLHEYQHVLERLTNPVYIKIEPEIEKPDFCATEVVGSIEIRVPLGDLIDLEAERLRLQRRIDKASTDMNAVAKKLSNESFVAKAPPEVVERERKRETDLAEQIRKLIKNRDDLAKHE